MSETTACQKIGRWVAGFNLDDAPLAVRETATRCWVDVIGCMLGGAATDAVKPIQALARAQHGDGPCRIVGTDWTTNATGAALANGTAAHALDFDDTSYAGVAHGSATIAAVVLAIADQEDAGGDAAMTAFIAGLEAEYALGMAASNAVFMDGWWGTSLYGGLGAAAAAAKLLGLDGDTTATAMAHALCRTGGLRAMLGTDAKFIGNGQTASLGVTSALLAQAGATAPLDALEGTNGFAQLIKRGPLDLQRFAALGKSYALQDPGVFLKPYASCSASHAAAEATVALIAQHGLSADRVQSVDVDAPQLVCDSLVYDSPSLVPEGQFSMPFILASILVDGDFTLAHLSAEALHEPRVRAVMPRIALHHDAALTRQANAGEVGPECARVRLTTTDGETLTHFNSLATGAPDKPMSDAAIDRKFIDLASFGGHQGRGNAWLARLRDLPTAGPTRQLWN